MNLINKKWIVKGKAKVKYYDNKLEVKNTSNKHSLVFLPTFFKKTSSKKLIVKFDGICKKGNATFLEFINRKKQIISRFNLGISSVIVEGNFKYYMVVLYVPAQSDTIISHIDFDYKDYEINYDEFNGDTLVVTPGYPSEDNKYNCAFIHTRVQAYRKLNWNIDVVKINAVSNYGKYNYHGIDVYTGNFYFLRTLLQKKHYKKILIHFFDNNYANV